MPLSSAFGLTVTLSLPLISGLWLLIIGVSESESLLSESVPSADDVDEEEDWLAPAVRSWTAISANSSSTFGSSTPPVVSDRLVVASATLDNSEPTDKPACHWLEGEMLCSALRLGSTLDIAEPGANPMGPLLEGELFFSTRRRFSCALEPSVVLSPFTVAPVSALGNAELADVAGLGPNGELLSSPLRRFSARLASCFAASTFMATSLSANDTRRRFSFRLASCFAASTFMAKSLSANDTAEPADSPVGFWLEAAVISLELGLFSSGFLNFTQLGISSPVLCFAVGPAFSTRDKAEPSGGGSGGPIDPWLEGEMFFRTLTRFSSALDSCFAVASFVAASLSTHDTPELASFVTASRFTQDIAEPADGPMGLWPEGDMLLPALCVFAL